MKILQDKVSLFAVSVVDTINRHRIVATFILVLVALVLADAVVLRLGDAVWGALGETKGFTVISQAAITMMDFAPEVWVGILALVLGTLVIVISIASQSTPKLIDLYMRDWVSLMYVWFISLTLVHNLILQFVVGDWDPERTSSIILSTGVFLPLSALLAVPYIFYILGLTRPDHVIQQIHTENMVQIRRLVHPTMKRALQRPEVTARHQVFLFDALNQLDDLLEYLSFKEPKGRIIRSIGSAMQLFARLKKDIPAEFFQISEEAREDISFKTLAGQFDAIKEARTLYSQKAFRLLGYAYMRFLERGDFELSTLCVVQVTEVGRVALVENDDPLVALTIIRFNTMLRFGIKQGIRQADVRNLYNAIDQYGTFIQAAVDQGKAPYVEEACRYLKTYGSEIYRISRDVRGFEFLVDVVAAELRAILIAVAEVDAPIDLQARLLDLMLQLDVVPDIDKKELQTTSIVYDRVRILQVSLALYYLRVNQEVFAHRIVNDILEDFEYLGESLLREAVDETIRSLEQAHPTFWEDTDRGTHNIYYSPDTEYLPAFRRLCEEALVGLVSTNPEL